MKRSETNSSWAAESPGNPASAFSMPAKQFHSRLALDADECPLTPALSLGERENRPPLGGESNALRLAGGTALNRGPHGAFVVVSVGGSQVHWCFENCFPLTPALSLGERENRPLLGGESNALRRGGVSALNRGPHGAFVVVSVGSSQVHWCFENCFPLTPALSLGERENRPPLGGESNALRRGGVSALNRGPHGAFVVVSVGSSQVHWCFENCFPLTPALSLGERENRPPLGGESNALRR